MPYPQDAPNTKPEIELAASGVPFLELAQLHPPKALPYVVCSLTDRA